MTCLVVVDEFLQFVSVNHDVQATHLSQPELLSIHTGEAHLERKTSHGQLVLLLLIVVIIIIIIIINNIIQLLIQSYPINQKTHCNNKIL